MSVDKKLIIGIDVDGVVCDSCMKWLNMLINSTNVIPELVAGKLPYNLLPLFKNELDILGIDGNDFWRQKTLYDNMEAYPDAIIFINYLHKQGYEIVFVSTLKGDHHKSKVEFLKRNFHFDGFIGTKEKNYARVDVMIDDNIHNLRCQPEGVHRILFNTVFTEVPLETDNVEVCTNWFQVYDKITKIGRS